MSCDTVESYRRIPTLWRNIPRLLDTLGTRFCFPEIKRLGSDPNHSPPSSAKVKNARSHISTPPYVFIAWWLIWHRGTARWPCWSLSFRFWDKNAIGRNTFLISPQRSTCHAHLILLDLITLTIFCEAYELRSTSLCSLATSLTLLHRF
jgi:hypothetical protein